MFLIEEVQINRRSESSVAGAVSWHKGPEFESQIWALLCGGSGYAVYIFLSSPLHTRL